jgi:hypothetical protein
MSDQTLGAEVTPNEDGTLSAVEKMAMPKELKEYALKYLAEAAKYIGSVMDKVKAADEGEGGMEPAMMGELKKAQSAIQSMLDKYPSPKSKAKADADKEEDEEEKKAKKKQDEEEEEDEEKAKAKKGGEVDEVEALANALFDTPLGEVATQLVEKAGGKRMTPARRARLKALLQELQKFADEFETKLDAQSAEQLVEAAIGTVSKRFDDKLAERLAELQANLAPQPITEEPVPDGQAASTDSADKPVAKSEAKPESWQDLDLNNPDLFPSTADQETTFFE